MKEVKYTKTATFLFPLLEVPKAVFTCRVQTATGYTKFTNRFLNAYCANTHVNKFNDENYIFLAIKNYRDVEFDTFYSKLTSFSNYVDSYDYNDCLISVFKPTETTLEDFKLVKQGLYSKVSSYGRGLILDNCFWSGKSNETVIKILNRDIELKNAWEKALSSNPEKIIDVDLGNQEVWSKINIEQETLNKDVLNTFIYKKELKTLGEFE